jgi:hypothetical protein
LDVSIEKTGFGIADVGNDLQSDVMISSMRKRRTTMRAS